MARVKRGVISLKRRRKTLRMAKGFRHGRSTKERLAREALLHAGKYAFRDRRAKKRLMRGLWNTKISAGATPLGISYSKLMGAMKKRGVVINRKVLSELAEREPETFAKIVREAVGQTIK